MNKDVVITYFEPFGGRDTNVSKEVVSQFVDDYFVIELPVSWSRSIFTLKEKIPLNTQYLFLVGEAGSYQNVTIELVARNIKKGKDNNGVEFEETKIDKNGPEIQPTTMSFGGVDLGANYGDNAGKYLCNYIYYSALKEKCAPHIVFIHLPYPKENLSINDMKNRLNKIIEFITN